MNAGPDESESDGPDETATAVAEDDSPRRSPAKWLSTNKFRVIEAYSVAAPMYVITGYVIFAALRQLERRFAVRR